MRVGQKHVLRNALNLDITRELVIMSWPELISIYYILNYIKRAFVIITFMIAPSYRGHNVATYVDIPEIGRTLLEIKICMPGAKEKLLNCETIPILSWDILLPLKNFLLW